MIHFPGYGNAYTLAEPPGGGCRAVEVEYAPSNKRSVWLKQVTAERLRLAAAKTNWTPEQVIQHGLEYLSHRYHQDMRPMPLEMPF